MPSQTPESTDYQLLLAEPGILIEVLLPKKSRFQGTLHNTLKEGADIEKVRMYFTKKHGEDGLRKLLGFYRVFSNYTTQDVAEFETVFRGYSIYEVDGVFYSIQSNQATPTEYEERTQIIKLIFVPNYDEHNALTRERKISLARIFLPLFPASWRDNGNKSIASDESFTPTIYDQALSYYVRTQVELSFGELGIVTDNDKKYILYLIRWTNYVGLWVFGYLIYGLVERMYELKEDYVPEAEIWVTSQWDYLVNKLKLYNSTT